MNKHTIHARAHIDGRKAKEPMFSSADPQQMADWSEPHIAHMAIVLFA